MLAVVQYQQQLPSGQILRQRGGPRVPGPVLQAQRHCDGLGHQRLIPQLVQPDQPHPAGKRPRQPGGGPQRQPGLADPADPGQRHQPGAGQQPPDLGQLTAAADEAGQLRRQIPGYARPRCHDNLAAGISREGPAQALPLDAHVPHHAGAPCSAKITCDNGPAPSGPIAPATVPGRCPGRPTSAPAADLRLNHAVPSCTPPAGVKQDPDTTLAASRRRSSGPGNDQSRTPSGLARRPGPVGGLLSGPSSAGSWPVSMQDLPQPLPADPRRRGERS